MAPRAAPVPSSVAVRAGRRRTFESAPCAEWVTTALAAFRRMRAVGRVMGEGYPIVGRSMRRARALVAALCVTR